MNPEIYWEHGQEQELAPTRPPGIRFSRLWNMEEINDRAET
jgi:hypothetical protein